MGAEFEAVKYVGGPAALVAFVAAVAGRYLRARLLERRRMIESASEASRAELVESAMRDFKVVDSTGLTREQRYQLIQKLIDQRLSVYKLAAWTLMGVGVLVALATVARGWAGDPYRLVVRLRPPAGASVAGFDPHGKVRLEAGHLSREATVVSGEGRFDDLPRSLVGAAATVRADVSGFAPTALEGVALPTDGALSLQLAAPRTEVCGRVLDASDPKLPLAGAEVEVRGQRTTTAADGAFCLFLPVAEGTIERVSVLMGGRIGYSGNETLSSANVLALRFAAGGAP